MNGKERVLYLTASSVSIIAALFVLNAPSYAQKSNNLDDPNARAAAIAEGASEAEIVVTARRREEKIQEVPISLAVLGDKELRMQGVSNVSNLDTNLANVSIGSSIGRNGGAGVISIRGIGEVIASVNRDPGVGLYVDDIYFGRADGNFMNLVDIERVEVLRGPQGTLFGKNTTGGAVRLVSKLPSFNNFAAELQGSYGWFDRRKVEAKINVPVTDNLAVRFTGVYDKQDGWFLREVDGVKVDDKNFKGIRGQLRWAPTPRFSLNLSAFYGDSRNNGAPVKLIGTTPLGTPGNTVRVTDYNRKRPPGAPVYGNGSFVTINPDSTVGGLLETYTFDGIFLSGVAEYEVSDAITAKVIAGYNDNDVVQVVDRDVSPANVYDQVIRQNLNAKSVELQILGNTEVFQWVTGLYYFHENPIDKGVYRDYSRINTPPAPAMIGTLVDQDTKSYAAFAQGTFTVTDWLKLTAGIRYTKEDKRLISGEFDARIGPVSNPDPNLPLTVTARTSFDDFSPMFNIAVKPAEDILLYGTVSKGFRSGGINDNLDRRLPMNGIFGFEPEKLWSYELGLKSQWFDRRLTLNATVFTADYSDLQVTLVDPIVSGRYFANAAKARIRGMEAETQWEIVPGLRLIGTLGLLDAKYTELDIKATVANTLTLNSAFARAPRTSYSLGLRFDHSVGNAGNISFSTSYGAKSKQQSTAQNITAVTLPSYGLLSGRLQFNSADDRWFTALYCTNCLDKRYLRGGVNFTGRGAFGSLTNEIGKPFEAGITVGFKFFR